MSIVDTIDEFRGKRVTVMGLGLHGGGIASARFFAKAGAEVTVTDLRGPETLEPAMCQLGAFPVRYVLGAHYEEDFAGADIVIKNPAVRRDSPFLKLAGHIETDISIFLRFSKSPLIAVTGSKGKSTVASAIWHVLSKHRWKSLLGGNITVSPLDFLDETGPDVPVVLELSSWQLGDLRTMGILKPMVAVITAIFPDHLNYYGSMEAYVADKRVVYEGQDEHCYTICSADQDWGSSFAKETRAQVLWYSERPLAELGRGEFRGGWLAHDDGGRAMVAPKSVPTSGAESLSGFGKFSQNGPTELLVPHEVLVPGLHQKKNLLAAAVALRAFGVPSPDIASAIGTFPGVPHRLELVACVRGVKWYNDSTATIPDAAIAAIDSFFCPTVLIAGGSDKMSDFSAFIQRVKALKAVILLAGSGTDRIAPLLDVHHIAYEGPFSSMRDAVDAADRAAEEGDVVLLSPGCASFGMFLHEFERGESFKQEVARLATSKAD
jgi:UDP-N-acetylmuramoylalanine--D-glutamate ligase